RIPDGIRPDREKGASDRDTPRFQWRTGGAASVTPSRRRRQQNHRDELLRLGLTHQEGEFLGLLPGGRPPGTGEVIITAAARVVVLGPLAALFDKTRRQQPLQ